MFRSFRTSLTTLGLVTTGVLVGLLGVASSAMAFATPTTTTTVTCTTMQAVLDASNSGDVIHLATGSTCPAADFTLPPHAITLDSLGTGATLDGAAAVGGNPILHGTDVGSTTIRNLTLRNGHDGGLAITGSSAPTLASDTFFHNSGSVGAGAWIQLISGIGPVVIRDSTFDGNTATTDGGGLYLSESSSTLTLTLTGNVFSGNSITTAAAGSHRGGGAYITSSGGTVTQGRNDFAGNSINSTGTNDDRYGAGEFVYDLTMDSTGDHFAGNSINFNAQSQGAGLWYGDCTSSTATLTQDVFTGNSIPGGAGQGAAIYAGCVTHAVHMVIHDSTIIANATGVTGTGGIWGGVLDTLAMHNTIDTGNIGADTGQFATITADHTDACLNGAALAGTGNLCADPKLSDPDHGNVRETADSPTLNAGLTSELPSGIATDFYGGVRVVGSSIDIGASELPTFGVSPTTAVVGSTIIASGAGFAPGETVTFGYGHGQSGNGFDGVSATADSNGAFSVGIPIPASFAAGAYTISAIGGTSGDDVFAALTLTAVPVAPPVAPPVAAAPASTLFTYGAPVSTAASATAPVTVTLAVGGATAVVTVPAGALPAGTTVSVFPATATPALIASIPSNGSYVLSFAVAWKAPDGSVPVARAPITLTVNDAAIAVGDTVYMLTATGLKAVGTATATGSITITFTEDPTFILAAAPKVVLRSKAGRVATRTASFSLACTNGARCNGTASLVRTVTIKRGTHKVTKHVVIATGSYRLVRGARKFVAFHLTSAGRALVNDGAGARVSLTLTLKVTGGMPLTSTVSIRTLRHA